MHCCSAATTFVVPRTTCFRDKSGDYKLSLVARPFWRVDSRNFLSCSCRQYHGLHSSGKKAGHDFSMSPCTKDGRSIATLVEDDHEVLGVLDMDPALREYEDHLRYRSRTYSEQKKQIEKYEGSLEEFAKGYLKFGLNREDNYIVYREWAPAAQFPNYWNVSNCWEPVHQSHEHHHKGKPRQVENYCFESKQFIFLMNMITLRFICFGTTFISNSFLRRTSYHFL